MVDTARNIADLLPENLELLEALVQEEDSDLICCPLSYAQQRLWFLDQLEPGNPVYNLPTGVRMRGALDLSALQRSLNEIIRRHEALRTRFVKVDGEPLQIIEPELELPLEVFDLTTLNEQEREIEALRLTHTTAALGFDLTTGPLLRATLLRLSADDHMLLVTMHHIISDGWSLGVLVREVGALYRAFTESLPSPLPELPVQYADYAVWQREQVTKESLAEQLDYWREQLSGAPAVLGLPVDRVRPAVKSYRGAIERLELSAELVAALNGLSREHGVTLFMVLLAAFKVLLWRYAGQADVVVGTPIANRRQTEIEGLIGFFVNTLALRTRLEGGESFRSLLQRVREVCLGAYQHQDVPFEMVVEEMAVDRAMGQTPLFQVMFAMQAAPSTVEMKDLQVSVLQLDSGTAKFDLLVTIEEGTGGGLEAVLEYDTDLYERETARRMLGHYENVLEEIVQRTDACVGKLSLLSEQERQQLLEGWNDTEAEYPSQSVCELFEAVAAQAPEKVAVLFEQRAVSYDELNRRANQLARYLRKRGVGPETVVAVLTERSVQTIVSLLAVLKAGGAYLPLEVTTPSERLLFMLADCGVKLLLTDQRLHERLPVHSVPVVLLDQDEPLISNESEQELSAVGIAPDQLAYVMYTSGSTGKPKGIGIPHRAIVRLVRGANYARLTADEVMLQAAPLSFDAATLEIWGSLLNGGRLVLLPAARASLEELGRTVKEHQVTTMWLTAGLFHLMVEERIADLQGVRQLLAGGDVLSVAHVERALRELEGCQVINGYGPTENTTFTCCYPMTSVTQVGETVSIGRPISNTKVYLLDANLQPVPVGVTGELYIGGDGLARGYFNQPSLTAEKFIPDPFTQGERLYCSGDLARYLADGRIEFLGRMDEQAKIRGFRIEPSEIQTVLVEHPGVAQSVVLVRAGGARSEKTLLAYVVADEAVSSSELRTYLQARLPEYMIPAAFIKVAAIPLTANGKVDRAALLALETNEPETTAGYVGPRTLVEELLAGIWTNLLEVERVGIHDNFFELGGHSLLAVRLLSRVRGSFQVEVTLHSLFETPTVAGLAEEIERQLRAGQRSQALAIVPVERGERVALSFAQQRLWFLDQLNPDSAFYNVLGALRLTGNLNVAALQESLNEVVRRHEALRTTFVVEAGEPAQVIAPVLSVLQPVEDLSTLPEVEREAEQQRLMAEEGQRPFDLARGPLLRAKLLRLAADEHVALFTMHHIISDGWSMGVLVQEIATLYGAFAQDEPSPLPELPVQYADYAVCQRQWLQGEVVDEQLNYWREQLSSAPAVLGLPADHVRPAVKSYRGARERLELSAELTAVLHGLSREHGVTLFMVLLAAFKVLLWRYAGQADVVVGTPIANRRQSEIEGLIGFFVNTLALRTQVEGGESFRSLLQRVREVCLGAYQHQDVPFEMVVEEMAVERALNYTPIFQVMFVLQNTPASELLLEDVEISFLEVDNGTAKFDLLLNIEEENDGGLEAIFEYDTDLFAAASIKRLVGHYENVLQEIVQQTDACVGTLSLLTEQERHQLLKQWNETEQTYPLLTLPQLFEKQVERTPQRIAVEFGEEQISYQQLNRRANKLAHCLRKLGVGPDVVVAIMMERSVETILSVVGVLKAGGAYMLLDPEYPSERRLFMLADSSARVVLTRQSMVAQLGEQKAHVWCVDRESVAGESEENPINDVTPDNLAYVIYTSGSTGRPKGVAMSQRPMVNMLVFQSQNFDDSNGPRTLQFASLSFDVSFQEIFSTFCAGATLVLIDEEVHRDVKALWQVLVEKNIERLFLPFVALQQLAEVVATEVTVPSRLREVITAGEQLKVTGEIRRMFEKLAGCTLQNQYGPSETHVATAWQLPGTPDEWPHLPPIGTPITNTQIYVLDEWLQPVPIGVVGELYIGGDCLARGYIDRPEQTAERFIPDPFSERGGERLYKTGDLARYLDNGCLDFAGRSDHQVKVRGFRIEIGEIEAALKQHPAVKHAVVHAWDDKTGQKRLAAYVVATAESLGATTELRNHLRELLPEYMIPSAFVLLEDLPLTPSGKVDRRALTAPDSLRSETEGYAAPRTPVEEVLAGIWANLLGFDQVGINDNFFDLGGHSLLATRLMSQIRDTLQIDLPLRQLFEHPTIATLGESIVRSRQKSPLQPLTLSARPETIPLSFAQQRLWFLDQMEPGSSFYNISSALRLNGPLDRAALEKSLAEVVRRHEVLRTTFQMSGQGPVQIIASETSFSLPALDLSALPAAERELEAQAMAAAEAARPFDLSALPLLRATLLRLSAEEHVLLLTMHHIISDGWSLGLMVKEVATLYQAFSRELPSPLPELRIQYADYALWQRQQLNGALLDEQLTYWREQLQSAPAVLALPADHSRPAIKRYHGARETFHISEELTLELKALSRAQRVTTFMLLLTAFKVLLSRYSKQEDIVVGTPIANRQESQIEDLVGFFVNTLAVRTRLEPTERFGDLLKRVREVCLAAYQHQAVPFELIVEELAVERSLSYTPIFQVMFALQNEPLVPRQMEDIEIQVIDVEGRTAKVDLLMAIEAQEAGGFRAVIEYDTDLFEPETMRRLGRHYQKLLQAVANDVDEQIGKLPLLGEEERQRILVTWNETKADYPEQSVSELFEAVVERTPEEVALLFEEQRLSYRELNQRANQLAHHLRRKGVGPEVVVAVLTERSVETIVGLLAVLKAGGAYLPLEVSTPPERLMFMIEDCGAQVLLTQPQLLERLPAHDIQVVLIDADHISNESEQNLSPVGVSPENLAYVMFTSGSTGKPKGIGIPHRGIVRLVRGANYANLSTAEVMLHAAVISFDAATFEIWGSLLNGGRLVLLPGERASLEDIGRAVKEHQVTTLWLTAGLFHLMVEERIEDLQGVRQLLAGGDVLSVAHVERALRALEGCRIINGYGPTENTTFTCCYPMTSVSQVGGTVSIGRPISNTKVYVLDANLQPAPVGVTGELYTGGDGLARGYFNQPSLTAEKFIPDPFSTQGGERLYKTGDHARYLANGNLEFVGRMDHQVKLRGFRIEPTEIETVLAEHPAVAQCVVLVRVDRERDKTLLAYVVAEQTVSVSELRTWLQPRLPEYMIPASFVMLSAMPLTPNGKVDRSALLALDASQPDSTSAYAVARTPVEEMLVGIWSNLLGVQRVGIHDNFFELGGHSLLAVRLLSRVRASFEVEVTLHNLFETATVAGLAAEIERRLRAGQTSLAMPIARAQREGKLPLSFAQQRLWFLNQLEPESGVYNVPVALRLKGALNVSAFELSLCEVVRRHEALRTTFVMSEGEPSQVIAPELAMFLPVEDLRAFAATERKAETQRLIAEEAGRPFDLSHGPLLRAKLLRLAEDEHVVLFTMHHIISDGWSMGVLVQEIAALYQAFSMDQPPLLPELPVQYADYAISQREWLQDEVLEEKLGYWREHLSDAPAVLELPADHARPAVKSYRGALERLELSAELTAALNALSREHGVTLFMVLLAAFKVLLWRYAGQADVVVGTPIANRQQSEIEGLIGFFVNTLALRTKIERHESFTDLLKRVREVCLGAYQHQDVPFEMVVDEIAVERSLNHAPIFQVMFALQNAPMSELLLEDVEISLLEMDAGTAKFDLTLRLVEARDALSGQLEYDTDLFEAGSIKRLLGHYEKLLEEIVRDAEQAVSALPLLRAEERQQLVVEWNQTSAAVPESCLHELFEEQVERTPNAVAVVFEGQRLSYRELNCRANQLAHHLRDMGVGPEVLVGVLLGRSAEMVASLLAVLKAGGAYVALDVQTPEQRLRFMLEDAGVKLLLSQRETMVALPEYAGPVVYVEQFAAKSAENLAPLVTADNLAYVIYTSGSTGAPKGVLVTHRAICNHLQWRQRAYPLNSSDRFLHKASISFDISVWEIFGPLLAGSQLVLAKPGGQQESAYLARLMAEEKVTVAHFGPAMLQVWLQEPELGQGHALKQVFCGGEPLTVEQRNSFFARFNHAGLCHQYGPTEATVDALVWDCAADGEVIPLGRPIANTRAYVLDEELQPVPVGVAGELHLAGTGLARGYLNRADLTGEKFIPDPFSAEGERLYKTGDRVRYLADGNLEFLGRLDDQVKIRGFRVEVGEVETVLEQHEQIKQAVVAAREADAGGKILVAYLVAQQSELPATGELRAFLKQRLPEYMVPAAFVFLSELPLTTSGKLNRRALPAPEPGRAELGDGYVGPRSETEALVCSLWAGILKVERVGVYDNFFELGGHSLLATQLVSRMREAFRVEIPLRLLFEQPTVAGLTQGIEAELLWGRKSMLPVERLSLTGPVPLSFAQQRLWFLNQLEPNSAVYNLPAALRLTGKLNVAALQESLNEVVRRHEALRTTFVVEAGEPAQVIAPVLSVLQPVEDLSTLPEPEREAEQQRLMAEEGQRPFDLARGPLLRAKLLRLAADEHVALFTMHHIISDGWSRGVLVQEIATLYGAFAQDEPSPLPELPVQYADYAVCQRQWLQGEVLDEQLSYWREQLSGAPAVLGLPADHVRPAVKSYRGARERLELSAELTAVLHGLSREQGVTLFMVLLAAFKVLLWRYAGQADVVVGTPIANRRQSEIEGLIGFFVNTLALRTRLEGGESFRSLLQRVREVCLGAYQHQDVPFEMVVEEMAVERALNYTPIFQVMFVLQNTPASELLLEDVEISFLEVESGTAKFDLTLTMREDTEGRLSGQVEYDTDLFEAASISRLVDHYQKLLHEIVRDGAQAVGAVPLLGTEERQQLLVEWNQTSAAVPESCLHELFEAQVERMPGAVAVQCGVQQVNYGELNCRANQVAHHLRGMGVGPEVLVGVLMERSVEMLVALLGILKAGAAYLPLDADYPQERLSFMLSDAEVRVLLTQERLLERVPATEAQVLCMDRDWPAISIASEENPRTSVTPDNLVYVIYTSGSTGQPKGAMLSHRGIVNCLFWMQATYRLGPTDRFLHKTSLGFDPSVWELFWPLMTGAQIVMAQPGEQLDSAALLATIVGRQVTHAYFVPPALELFLTERGIEQATSLRQVICGGESLATGTMAQFFHLLKAELHHSYGPTETSIAVSEWRCEHDAARTLIGKPLANTQLYVLDQRGEPALLGASGELYVGGAGVGRGYLGRSELTADRFIPDKFSGAEGARLYRTGDRVRYLADGNLEFLGRLDDQVKIRGFRVEVGEVETVLEQHEQIKQAVVAAREADAGGKILVAYLVAQQSEPPATAELRAFLKQRLPEYMVPAAFIFLSELPLTTSGKLNRRALPAPEPGRAELGDGYVGPRNETEALVCSLWAGILKVERVGIYDNFFELGGHSLLATQLVSRMREAFRVEIPLRLLFEQPTVAGLTQSIEAELLSGRKSMLPVERLSLTGPVPLSFAQQRLWFLDQFTPDSSTYNMTSAIRLSGSLDLPALQRAFKEILRRHELLRTSFAVIDGDPVQIVSEPRNFDLTVLDLSHLEKSEREQDVQRLAREEAHRPFDLTQAPLFRATLLRLAPAEHALLLTIHHIVSDGWSLGILIREMTTLYEAFSADRPSPLAELPVQYADYAVWQREQLQGETLEEQLRYWREQLQGAPVLLELPTGKPRPPVQSYRGTQLSLQVAPETTRALNVLSQQHGVTLFMTLLAAFQVLLYRYTGQDDIVVGTPVAGRTRRETEGLIGLFLNTLALRVSLNGDPTFATLLSRVREACLGAYAHQDVPFERLLEELAPERNLSHTPIFQVMFNMLNLDEAGEQLELNGVKIEPLPIVQQEHGAKFELELYAREQGDGLQLHLVYSELYTSVAMEQLLEHFHTLLQAVAAEPARPVTTFALSKIPSNESSLIRPANPFVVFEQDEIQQTIQERFEKQVRSYPGNIAIKIGKESWTYEDVNYKANQIARAVLAASDGEQRFALLLNHDASMVAGILGLLKAGKTYVPLNTTYPEQRLIEILRDSEAVGILTNDANLLLAEALIEEQIPVINLDRIDPRTPGDNLPVQGTPDSLAYILHTSGSTGKPKGVVQNHRNVLHHIRAYTNNLHICANDKLSLFSSYAVDAAVQDILGALLNGATVCPIDLRAEDPNKLPARLNEEEITIYHSTPTVFRYFVDTLKEQENCPSVRLVVLGGEAALKSDFELFKKHFSPLCLFVNGLGLTESTIGLQYFADQQTEITHDTVPVGYAVENTEVSLVNEAGEQVAIYGVGEIVIKSPHLALGYWRQPELTETQFRAASADGYWRSYRTGDLGRWLPNGTIEFVGRRDHQVKIRGHRVELGEVEAALRTCRGVKECAVVMRDGERLAGYVVKSDNEVSVSDWRRQLEERLPQYMVPSVFMVLDEMPLTTTGKVARLALPEVDVSRAELGSEYEAPRTETEETLASIWRDVLRVERVGIHDNFFERGGHSLLATRMVSFVRERFNVELALRSVFESPTVAGLAARVETMLAGEQGLALPAIERVERVGHLPLSYAQQRLWFLDQFEPERAVYNISHCFELSGTLEVVLLERAFNDVLRRHESLRTIFVNGQDGPVQVISPFTKTSIPVEDLQGLSEAEREAEVSRIAAKQVRTPFDLSVGPLIRVSLVRLSSEEHLLMLTLHHIICDGWSIAVLMQELVRLYQGYSNGEAPALEELPVQYADYAVWQRQWLQGAVLEQQLEYWKQQLAGAPAVLSLSADRARPPRQTFKGGRVQQSLTPELSEQLQQLSRGHEVTLFMTLLAGFQLLLARYSGQEDVVVGTPIANRTRRELEGLIGFFANTLALRTELSGNPRFTELLERVREVCLGAYQHQDLPFEKLVEELQPARSLSHSPIFQVMFILQNNQAPAFEQRLGDLEFKSQAVESEAAKFDLTLSVGEWAGRLHCSLEYNTDLFDEETAQRLVRHWIRVLHAVSDHPAQRISEVPLLSVEERQQLLREWNQTAVEYAREKRVQDLIAEQSALRPEATAVICQGERLSYAELNGRANQLARYLQGLGVGPETVVGICMERAVEMMVGLLAVLKAGAAYLPLDPDYPSKRLEFMMADSQAPVLLTQARLQNRLTAPEQTRVVQVDHDWAEIAAESAAEVKTESEAGNLAYVIYTSGSTGEPKGVMISHGNVMNFVAGMDAVLGQDPGVWLAVTSISFDISVLELLWTLARGYEVVIHVGDKDSSVAALVARHEVTHLQCTPSMATILAADADSLRALSSLDTLLLGGEALPPSLAHQLSASSPASIVNMYGPTETTIWSSTYRLSGAPGTIPIGSPIANTQLYVLDQHLSPVPVNVAGELYIGGEGVVRGYQQRPDLTASRFIPDPFSTQPGARLYRTGDVARFRADGLVEYLGRADQQLKLRGYRIELGEIEAVLGTHAAVKECVVVPQGEMDDLRLVAYMVMQSGQSLNESELRQYARERLPQYMVPSVFLVIDKMPLTPNGKVNRRALPEVEASRGEREYEGPRNETEETLASIWREVLKVERVGIHDNFFELGGHSLLATRMVSLVRESFKVELPLRDIFETPTIAGLSVTLIQKRASLIESEELEDLIAKLEQLSEAEAQTILDTRVESQDLSMDASA